MILPSQIVRAGRQSPNAPASPFAAVREIPLSRGLVAIVDAADFDWLSQWKWYARKARNGFYAARNATKAERASGSGFIIGMHAALCPTEAGLVPDHANRDGLDNRRCNLRPATTVQNGQNCRCAPGASGYRGVQSDGRRAKWRCSLTLNGKEVFLGYFADPIEAARTYDAKARELRGEFAVLNFPEAA